MATRDLLRRLEALETGDSAPDHLINMLRQAQEKNGVTDHISPLISLEDCMRRFILLQPD
ncbi:hypothetical protein [Nitrosomonas sp. ANs5]|uniref:hypothetical protein n=1 Tax=Nitrosomonas sp. ANs5 TaxID=3423941 RepID=UPI003D33A763